LIKGRWDRSREVYGCTCIVDVFCLAHYICSKKVNVCLPDNANAGTSVVKEGGGRFKQVVKNGEEVSPALLDVLTKHLPDVKWADPRQATLTLYG
jgi:hypothetical protein